MSLTLQMAAAADKRWRVVAIILGVLNKRSIAMAISSLIPVRGLAILTMAMVTGSQVTLITTMVFM